MFTAWLGTPSLPTSLPAPTQPFSFAGGVGHKKTMSALVNTLVWDFFIPLMLLVLHLRRLCLPL